MAKGYGIFLVILGHLYLNDEDIKRLIYSFHMPLFFFLNGYLFKLDEAKVFFRKKIQTIIIPYFFLGIIIILFNMLYSLYGGSFSKYEVIRQLKCLLIQERFLVLWFLTCLFFDNLIFYILVRLKIELATIFITIFGILYHLLGFRILPWNIDVSLTTLIFFYGGYIFKKYNFYSKFIISSNKYIYLIILIGINWICTFKFGGELDLYSSIYGNVWYTYLGAFCGIFMVIIISNLKTIEVIRYIGESSIIFFAWHTEIIFPILNKIFSLLNFQKENISYFIITIVLLTIISKILLSTNLKYCLGKR